MFLRRLYVIFRLRSRPWEQPLLLLLQSALRPQTDTPPPSREERKMQVGTASSVPNPNASWLNSRGMWMGYIVSVIFLNFLLNLVPILSVPLVWTLTHGIHNVVRTKTTARRHDHRIPRACTSCSTTLVARRTRRWIRARTSGWLTGSSWITGSSSPPHGSSWRPSLSSCKFVTIA